MKTSYHKNGDVSIRLNKQEAEAVYNAMRLGRKQASSRAEAFSTTLSPRMFNVKCFNLMGDLLTAFKTAYKGPDDCNYLRFTKPSTFRKPRGE